MINPAGLRLTYAYDAASQRKYLIEPEGARFTYSFDAAGRTNYVANPQAQRATWSYDAASRVTGIHYANTTRTSYLYDNASRLLRVANLSSTSTTLSSFSYALDAVGQPPARRGIKRQPRHLELRQDLPAEERATERLEQLQYHIHIRSGWKSAGPDQRRRAGRQAAMTQRTS